MNIWLLRHAQARQIQRGETDEARPLTEGGKETARRLGQHLADSGLALPELILVSPATRTRQTARHVLDQPGSGKPAVEPRLWEALEEDLLKVIKDRGRDAESLMLVGHNPGLEWLVQWLTGQRLRLGMQPGTLVIIDASLPLEPGNGRIEKLVQPSDLI